MNRILTIGSIFALCFTLAACNTVRGIGQDVKKAGEVIESAGKK